MKSRGWGSEATERVSSIGCNVVRQSLCSRASRVLIFSEANLNNLDRLNYLQQNGASK